MSARFEEIDVPGYIRIEDRDGAQVRLAPDEALALLQWLFERQDTLYNIAHDVPEEEQATGQLPVVPPKPQEM